jgi:hypothetical protein
MPDENTVQTEEDFESTFDQLVDGTSMDDIVLSDGTPGDDDKSTSDEGGDGITAEGDPQTDGSEGEQEAKSGEDDKSVSDAEEEAEATSEEDTSGEADDSTAGDDGGGELAELKATNADLIARIAALEAKPAETPTATKEPDPPATTEPEPIYTEEESSTLAKYKEDWPEVAAGEALARKQDMVVVADYILDQVAKAYGPTVDYVNSRSGSDQYNAIVQLVPDYDDVRDKAIAWIDTQPGILQKAYNIVVESGSATEVAEFINRFKQETGGDTQEQKPAETTSASAPATAEPQKGAATKKAATALKSVKSTRGAASTEPDESDFSGAFNEFSKSK